MTLLTFVYLLNSLIEKFVLTVSCTAIHVLLISTGACLYEHFIADNVKLFCCISIILLQSENTNVIATGYCKIPPKNIIVRRWFLLIVEHLILSKK